MSRRSRPPVEAAAPARPKRMYMTTPIHWTVSSEDEGKARATDPAPVVASLGFRAAAAADQCASLARLLSPVLDVLIRLWLAGGFLVTDALQHMAPGSQVIMQDHLSPSVSLFARVATRALAFSYRRSARCCWPSDCSRALPL